MHDAASYPVNFALSALLNCFALLDDVGTPDAHARLLHDLQAHLTCQHLAQVPDMLQAMQDHLRQGGHALLMLSYELGAQMQGIPDWPVTDTQPALAQALLFRQSTRLSQEASAAWLAEHDHAPAAGIAGLQIGTTPAAFDAALARIHEYIEAGHTYQVNYTYRLQFSVYGGALALYRRLRARQPVPYGALVCLPDGSSVVSLSPELFVRHTKGCLQAEPMKGTARASDDVDLTAARAQALAKDPKNRAENLMIVDLLRNDLGRIADCGSVQVPELFAVRQYGQVLQMTSRIEARLAANTDLWELLQALYPCGSITGAPKKRTMEIIRELETAPRGLYTGALGWFAPTTDEQLADFCLSVPIRTMYLQTAQENGLCQAEMGVGAGIVFDSQSQDEFQECQLKASFLTALPISFYLFETMYASRELGCRHLDTHLDRLARSCAWFGLPMDREQIQRSLQQHCAQLPEGAHRLKLQLAAHGIEIHSSPLEAFTTRQKLFLPSQLPCLTQEHFWRSHKTSLRQAYDAAWQNAEAHGAFDTLFCNQAGQITEGGRSNIFILLNGAWYTPPLTAGVLPGIMRDQLLKDPKLAASERILSLADVLNASKVMLCNALRGSFEVDLLIDPT